MRFNINQKCFSFHGCTIVIFKNVLFSSIDEKKPKKLKDKKNKKKDQNWLLLIQLLILFTVCRCTIFVDFYSLIKSQV